MINLCTQESFELIVMTFFPSFPFIRLLKFSENSSEYFFSKLLSRANFSPFTSNMCSLAGSVIILMNPSPCASIFSRSSRELDSSTLSIVTAMLSLGGKLIDIRFPCILDKRLQLGHQGKTPEQGLLFL